jgi:hypothetical protein
VPDARLRTASADPATAEPAPSRPVRRRLHNLPTVAVFVVLAVGLAGLTLDHWRKGAQVVGAAPLLAALLRLVLPAREAGPLAIRSRGIDVVLYAGAAVAVVALASVVPTYYHHHI